MDVIELFEFFWSGPFSQWEPSKFELHNILFQNAEMYMMWFKDQIFSGGKLEDKILNAKHPSICKSLGKTVENFDKRIWETVAKQGVFRGNMAKFTQNPNLYNILMETYGKTLVEASPQDTIWGIGLSANDPRALQRSTWLGTNWLGEVLTEVRTSLELGSVRMPHWSKEL